MKHGRFWIRLIPGALAAAVLVTATVARSPRASGTQAGAEFFAAVCQRFLQQGGSSSQFDIPPLGGVTQPIGVPGNAVACSVSVGPNSSYTFATANIVQWDPETLAPDPTTVALRTRSFNPSELQYGWTKFDFFPPVVTEAVRGVAEPPRPMIAIDWNTTWRYQGHPVRYESNGPREIPLALQVPPGGGARTPLPGEHPVLGHTVCAGDDALQSLRILQSVMTTNTLSDSSCFEIIQRFRVPVRSRLHWIEVAFGVRPRPRYIDPSIAILDAGRASEPPVTLPTPLVDAPFAYFVTVPFWGAPFDLDTRVILEPGHDYWLLARVEYVYYLYSRTRTGDEGGAFAQIGPSFRRTGPDAEWIPQPDQALCFRLIGTPLGGGRPVPRGRLSDPASRDLEPPPGRSETPGRGETPAHASVAGPGVAPLRLGITPNPARGAAMVSWSGSMGAARVEVFDAQGRRVAGRTGLADREGQWLWRGVADDGRMLPAGVYLVRAKDGAGRVASDRMVLIR